jgi:hypothetical protein
MSEWREWDFPPYSERHGARRRDRSGPDRSQPILDLQLQVRGARGDRPARRRTLRYHILAELLAALRIGIGAVCGLILAGAIWFAVTFVTVIR